MGDYPTTTGEGFKLSNAIIITIIKMLNSNFSIKDIIDSLDVSKFEINKAIALSDFNTGSLTIRQSIDLDDETQL